MEYFWIVLSVFLALVSLGISGVFTLFFAAVSFFCGVACILYGIASSSQLGSLAESLASKSRCRFFN
jgi:hypothetical protein